MKKILILTLAILLSFSAGAFAGSDMIGKAVEGTFPLHINGQQSPVECIVIEGKSYAPVRFVGESAGFVVDFKNNQVYLDKKPVEPKETTQPQGGDKVKVDYLDATKVHFINLDIPDKIVTVQLLNGEYYINKGAFEKYFNVYKQTVCINGKTYDVKDPLVLVKLSDLGLKGTMNGDTLYIE